MNTHDLAKPTVPVAYAMLLIESAEAHGVSRRELLSAADVDPERIADPADRLSVLEIACIADRAMELTGEPGLGYDIALRSSLTSHGIMGFGMMTCSSLREAIRLGTDYMQLRVPVLTAELRVEQGTAAVTVTETVPLGSLRQTLLDLFLVKLARIGRSLTDQALDLDRMELWFDYRRPDYHHRFTPELPPMRFEMGANELRFDADLLDRELPTADPINARLVEDQCRREFEQLGIGPDLVAQVRSVIHLSPHGYPTLVEVAERLHTSSRTLKRRLREHGTSFHQLLDAERRSEAVRLLTSATFSIEQIAQRLGYADASSFRRAFQSWTGTTPARFRERSD